MTGCRSEWVVRLPVRTVALATAVLTYELGRRMGGRRLALASAMALCTTGLFVSELRQAGNDGPLGLFATLALYAAWRRLHEERGTTPLTRSRTHHTQGRKPFPPLAKGGQGGVGGELREIESPG